VKDNEELIRRVGSIALLVTFVLFDWWQVANRCEFSPPVDWSRLAFGLLLQASALTAWFTLDRWFAQLPRDWRLIAAAGVLIFAMLSSTAVAGAVRYGDVHGSWQWKASSKGHACPAPY
jgi:hypothetical protein